MSAPDITAAGMTRSFSWLRLCSQCLVALALFVGANVYTYETSGFFQREHEYTGIVSRIADHKNVRVVFAGDSHFAVPLNVYLNNDPAGPAYSVAYAGDSLRECFAKLRHVLATTPGIDTLIVTADPHMFAKGRLESSNRSFADRYFIEAWDRSGVQHNLWSAMLQQVPLFSEDYLQYFRRDLGALLTHSTRDARAGGDPLAWSRLTDAERMMEAVETGRGDHDGIGTVAQPFTWYARILDLARARHVRVIAARFPVHPGYAAQAPAAKVAEIDSFLLKSGVAQIIDLRDALTDPKDFGDPDHVNEAGAAPLVKILEQKLQQPLILRQPAVVVQRFDR
ncbi:MAG: hypothetical protein JWO04_5382 [Gammaproteobacteria bacterium]|nr:hypothetical protein [Gammaproteobacteria bacterium]